MFWMHKTSNKDGNADDKCQTTKVAENLKPEGIAKLLEILKKNKHLPNLVIFNEI